MIARTAEVVYFEDGKSRVDARLLKHSGGENSVLTIQRIAPPNTLVKVTGRGRHDFSV